MSTHNLFSIDIDLSYSDISGIYESPGVTQFEALTADAWITKIDVSQPLGSGIFHFKTDSLDAETAESDGSDLMVAFDVNALSNRISTALTNDTTTSPWADKIVINASNAGSTEYPVTSGTTSGVKTAADKTNGTNNVILHAVGNNDQDNTNLKKDLARYIAYQLTNGYSGLDIFQNETALVNAIATHLNEDVSTTITNQVNTTSNWTRPISEGGLAIDPNEAVNGAGSLGAGVSYNSSQLAASVIDGEKGSTDLGQFLQALVSNDSTSNADGEWTTVEIKKEHSFIFKLNFINIAKGTHHDTANHPTGGNNKVGDRSYLIKLVFPPA